MCEDTLSSITNQMHVDNTVLGYGEWQREVHERIESDANFVTFGTNKSAFELA
jgi:hypothetical protein